MFAGIQRVTLPMPASPGHVHCYLLPAGDGWTLVDTGLGTRETTDRWRDALARLDAPVTAIVITHFHPDHVGAAAEVAELKGAPVYQGALDYAQCVQVWGNEAWPGGIADWFTRNGVPDEVAAELLEAGRVYAELIHYVDPLGDYLASLERTESLAPRVALTGHGEPVTDPAGRAREIVDHHEQRLEAAEAALGCEPRAGYALSHALFPEDRGPHQRRFAVAETLSHLEHLVVLGRAARVDVDGRVAYTHR
jgi:glyoxylase-like metal-dependent hydrolase (beta-lactamase superfamily II)